MQVHRMHELREVDQPPVQRITLRDVEKAYPVGGTIQYVLRRITMEVRAGDFMTCPLLYRFRVVDWKTARSEPADPWQLAIYRLAWSEVCQIPLAEVDAVFYYVRSDQIVRPANLADRTGLEAVLTG